MSTNSDFNNEIQALTREFTKQQPQDVLQFCANHFLRRLEAQRHEFHLSTTHSSKPGNAAMAESTFPGSNPFGGGSISNADRGIHSVQEEDEHDQMSSPTATTNFQSPFSNRTAGNASGGFGSSNFMNAMPPMDGTNQLPSNYNFNRRTSVSAESMNPHDSASDNWTPPFHQKTPDQLSRLRRAVSNNFIFSHLDEEQTQQVLGALTEKPVPAKGIRVISQGDVGDYFYIIEKGKFDVYVSSTGHAEAGPDGLGKHVNEISEGGSFGELALMYNAPRAATVTSTEPSTLWQLDRVTFRRILMDSAFNRRKMYEGFLAEVPLLESLTDYERSKIADALSTQKFPPGQTIIAEGEPGENFYIIESGTADVYQRGKDGSINTLGKGDYFGELALLNDAPRAASVVSTTDVKLATLGKEGFQRLLGPAQELMRRNDPSKKDTDEVDPLHS